MSDDLTRIVTALRDELGCYVALYQLDGQAQVPLGESFVPTRDWARGQLTQGLAAGSASALLADPATEVEGIAQVLYAWLAAQSAQRPGCRLRARLRQAKTARELAGISLNGTSSVSGLVQYDPATTAEAPVSPPAHDLVITAGHVVMGGSKTVLAHAAEALELNARVMKAGERQLEVLSDHYERALVRAYGSVDAEVSRAVASVERNFRREQELNAALTAELARTRADLDQARAELANVKGQALAAQAETRADELAQQRHEATLSKLGEIGSSLTMKGGLLGAAYLAKDNPQAAQMLLQGLNLTPELLELAPSLSSPELRGLLRNPKVRALLSQPEQLAQLLETFASMAPEET